MSSCIHLYSRYVFLYSPKFQVCLPVFTYIPGMSSCIHLYSRYVFLSSPIFQVCLPVFTYIPGMSSCLHLYSRYVFLYSPIFQVCLPVTLSQSNVLKLDRVQNKAMRVILGTTKDTPIETMRYLLDLPSMETRHKVEQGKAHLSAMQNPKNPLQDDVNEEKGCRLARFKSWMGHAEQSIQHVCGLAELEQVMDWE